VLPERLSPARPLRHTREQRWITPEPLNVAPQLVGMALASPARRAWAMLVDVSVVGLLSGVSGFWLLGGLAAVVLQLRSKRGASRRRTVIGWMAAALIAALALSEGIDQWQARGERRELAAEAPELAASAPELTDAERIAELESQLREARKPRGWRAQIDSLVDDIGLGLGWGIVYFSLLPAWWGGQTVGKKLLRLRVVELTGAPMTVMRSLRRYGGYAAGMATGGMGFAQLLWDPNRQAIQDRTAHTAVIDLRVPRQVSQPEVAAYTAATATAPHDASRSE
jgi:RDD family